MESKQVLVIDRRDLKEKTRDCVEEDIKAMMTQGGGRRNLPRMTKDETEQVDRLVKEALSLPETKVRMEGFVFFVFGDEATRELFKKFLDHREIEHYVVVL